MDVWHVVSQVVDWLGENHSRRGRYSSGFMTLLSVAVGIGAWVVSKELIAKRNALKARLSQVLESRPLTATSVTDEEGQKVRFTGVLLQDNEFYSVTLTRLDARGSTETSSDVLHSLEHVDVYLRAHTPFILADFKR
ncbi:hypothetical protein [Pseudomonas botevensis]|uniref:hypothetical protein n=1 Tax=Pseudomonas botevensis TaxID=2842352 RepID=UPI001C3D0DFD|nr:hypothetical protein [Pseudomonas botevensis]MBV4477490.1 hypothetical protein [Pseudomonas botevensis]